MPPIPSAIKMSTPNKKRKLAPFPTQSSRHVLLPFDLRNQSLDILDDNEIRALLFGIFPGTTQVSEGRFRSYLSFTVNELPKEPWPLTVGGLPITINTKTEGRGPLSPIGRLVWGRPAISVCQQWDGRSGPISGNELRSIAAELHREIRARRPDVRLVEVMFPCDRYFCLVLGNETDINAVRANLPGKIAKLPAAYINDGQLNRPRWTQRRERQNMEPEPEPEPSRGIEDDTPYNVLRPGVMLRSTKSRTDAHPAELRSTSGVMVKNASGHCFMTAASHGIGQDETVFQSHPGGNQKRVLGKAIHRISLTDVAIVRLNDDIPFENELFQADQGGSTRVTRLLGENQGDSQHVGSLVVLNSPFTGKLEGCVAMLSVKIERSEQLPVQQAKEEEDEVRYISYTWIYTGQAEGAANPIIPADGTCGSVILDEGNRAVGFFQYHINQGLFAGMCASVSADEVVRAGYRLA